MTNYMPTGPDNLEPLFPETPAVPEHIDVEQSDPHTMSLQEAIEARDPETGDPVMKREFSTPADLPTSGPRYIEESPEVKTSRAKTYIVAGLVAAVGIAALALGISRNSGNDDTTPLNRDEVASAGATPGETPTKDTETKSYPSLAPEDSVGIPETSADYLNVAAPAEVIAEALEPVPSSLSADEAVLVLTRNLHIMAMSGVQAEMETSASPVELTPESLATVDELLGATFSSDNDINSPTFETFRGPVLTIARRLKWYGSEERYDYTKEAYEYATHHTEYTIDSTLSQDETSGSFIITGTTSTNFEALDADELFDNPDTDQPGSFQKQVDLVIEDDAWKIKNYIDPSL